MVKSKEIQVKGDASAVKLSWNMGWECKSMLHEWDYYTAWMRLLPFVIVLSEFCCCYNQSYIIKVISGSLNEAQ